MLHVETQASPATEANVLLYVDNPGPAVSYTVSASQPWISFTQRSGTLHGYGRSLIGVAVALTIPLDTSVQGKITIQAQGRPALEVPVRLTIHGPGVRLQLPDDGGTPPAKRLTLHAYEGEYSVTQVPAEVMRGNGVCLGPGPLPAWLSVQAAEPITRTPQSTMVNFAVNAQGLGPGYQSAWLSIDACNAFPYPQGVSVVLRVGGMTSTPSTLIVDNLVPDATQTACVQLMNYGKAQAFTVKSGAPWLTPYPGEGLLGDGASVRLCAGVDTKGLALGTHNAAMTVENTDGKTLRIPVVIHVKRPVLSVTPASIELTSAAGADDLKPVPIEISTPTGGMTVTVTSDVPWLEIQYPGGVIDPTFRRVFVVPRLSTLSAGEYRASVRVSIEGTDAIIVPVKLVVRAQKPPIRPWPPRLDFVLPMDGVPPEQTLQLSVNGTGTAFRLEVDDPDGWLRLSARTGQMPARLLVGVDKSRVKPESRTTTIRVISESGAYESVAIPVNAGELPTALVLPQVADGGGFKTAITLSNAEPYAVRAELKFLRALDDGTGTTVPWYLAFEGAWEPGWIEVPANGTVTLTTAGLPYHAQSGWASVSPAHAVQVHTVFQYADQAGHRQDAAVPPASVAQQRLFVPFDNTGGYVTSLALANGSDIHSAPMQASVRNESGTVLAQTTMPSLPPRGHRAAALASLLPPAAGQRGVVEIVSDGGSLAATGLRFAPGGAFTSFQPQSSQSTRFDRLTIPHVADGGSFRTAITLVNHDNVAAHAKVAFHWTIAPGAVRTWKPALTEDLNPDDLIIPPGGTITLTTAGAAARTDSGWAEIVTVHRIAAFAVFSRTSDETGVQEAIVPASWQPPAAFLFPYDNTTNETTGIAIANTSQTAAATIELRVFGATGARLATRTIELSRAEHSAFEVEAEFPGARGQGSVQVVPLAGTIDALALRFTTRGSFTSLPSKQPY